MTIQEPTKYKLPSRELKGEKVSEALFAVAFRRLPAAQVAHFIGSSEPYAAASLQVLDQLKLVDSTPGGYQAIPLVAEDMRKLSREERYLVMARYAVRYKPFVEFVALIYKGYDSGDAAKKVNVIYDLGTGDHFIEKILLEIGLYSRLLKKIGERMGLNVIVEELPRDYIDRLKEATLGEVQARLFIRERLGDSAYQYLGEEQVDDFVHALLEYRKEPEDAIIAVGRAAEDFVRTIAHERGKNGYAECNGITELAQRMRSESPPLILPGHLGRAQFLGMIRNPGGGHGKDKETLERWNVSAEAALEAILVGLSTVRSVHAYVFDAQQFL